MVDTAVNVLYSLSSKVWKEEKVPARKESIIIKVPIKGDLMDSNNYRGIMLVSITGKVLKRIFLERMKDTVDTLL
jgi:hypothetical protein